MQGESIVTLGSGVQYLCGGGPVGDFLNDCLRELFKLVARTRKLANIKIYIHWIAWGAKGRGASQVRSQAPKCPALRTSASLSCLRVVIRVTQLSRALFVNGLLGVNHPALGGARFTRSDVTWCIDNRNDARLRWYGRRTAVRPPWATASRRAASRSTSFPTRGAAPGTVSV